MTESSSAGAARLDPRVERRDRSPLTNGELVRVQIIGLEKSPAKNLRWKLFDDGRLYVARHSPDTSNWQEPFDTEYPSEPTVTVRAKVVKDVKKRLDAAGLAALTSPQIDATVEGGSAVIVTTRADGGGENEVVFQAVSSPLVAFFLGFADEHAP